MYLYLDILDFIFECTTLAKLMTLEKMDRFMDAWLGITLAP